MCTRVFEFVIINFLKANLVPFTVHSGTNNNRPTSIHQQERKWRPLQDLAYSVDRELYERNNLLINNVHTNISR